MQTGRIPNTKFSQTLISADIRHYQNCNSAIPKCRTVNICPTEPMTQKNISFLRFLLPPIESIIVSVLLSTSFENNCFLEAVQKCICKGYSQTNLYCGIPPWTPKNVPRKYSQDFEKLLKQPQKNSSWLHLLFFSSFYKYFVQD